MRINVWADWERATVETPATPAELSLITACTGGTRCWLNEGERPDDDDPEHSIRADLLRYLVAGGCPDLIVDHNGVQVQGAWIQGVLDLDFLVARGQTSLVNCAFEKSVEALQSRLQLLNLTGSAMPGLMLQGARIEGSCFLRRGFHSVGQVSLAGARIGGQLDAENGRFEAVNGIALNAQDARIEGAVYLRRGFDATGLVSLSGAQIGGRLSCRGARFANDDGFALTANGMRVSERLTWAGATVAEGAVDLSSTHVGDLVDTLESWPQGVDRLNLDGFTYTRISASFTDARRRLDWLARGTLWNGEFAPQPYGHLASVLRDMGHDAEAREVLVEQRRLIGVHERHRAMADGSAWTRAWVAVLWLWDAMQHWTVGYGYKPFRSLAVLAGLFLIATVLAHRTWEAGDFAPNSGPVLISAGWVALASDPDLRNPAQVWAGEGLSGAAAAVAPGRDWETFNRYAYAFDVVVPILPLGQTEAWAPSTSRGAWGWMLWWMRWVLSGLGWIVTALGAAAVTGIIRRE